MHKKTSKKCDRASATEDSANMWPLVFLSNSAGLPYEIPTAKRVIRAMDDVISNHVAVYDFPAWSAIMEQVHRPSS